MECRLDGEGGGWNHGNEMKLMEEDEPDGSGRYEEGITN